MAFSDEDILTDLAESSVPVRGPWSLMGTGGWGLIKRVGSGRTGPLIPATDNARYCRTYYQRNREKILQLKAAQWAAKRYTTKGETDV
jgi:hypothetical protein